MLATWSLALVASYVKARLIHSTFVSLEIEHVIRLHVRHFYDIFASFHVQLPRQLSLLRLFFYYILYTTSTLQVSLLPLGEIKMVARRSICIIVGLLAFIPIVATVDRNGFAEVDEVNINQDLDAAIEIEDDREMRLLGGYSNKRRNRKRKKKSDVFHKRRGRNSGRRRRRKRSKGGKGGRRRRRSGRNNSDERRHRRKKRDDVFWWSD